MTLIFLHIPKSGGTTVCNVLRRNYAVESRFESYDHRPMKVTEVTPEMRKAVSLVFGHNLYGTLHPYFEPPFAYLTMLRDPVERVLSFLSYTRNLPGYAFAKDLSLEDRIRILPEASNHQTIMIGASLQPDFDTAAANLRSFAAVGVMEMFDESLELYQRTFGWSDIAYKHLNQTKERLRRDDLPESTIRLIKKQNEMDRELHALARELLLKTMEQPA